MDFREVRKAARKQGWTEKVTTKGFFFVPPDPTRPMILIHSNPTEVSLKHAVARMRKQGFVWPAQRV